MKTTRRALTLGFLAVGLLMLTGYGCVPKVSWDPPSVNFSVAQGESTTIKVSLVSSVSVDSAALVLSQELAELVSISPSFVSLKAGLPTEIAITVSPVVGVELGEVKGALHVMKGGKTIPRSLEVLVNVTKPFTQLGDTRIEYVVPAGWVSSNGNEAQNTTFLFSPEVLLGALPGDGLTPPDIVIAVLDNADGLSLSQYLENFEFGWYQEYAAQSFTFVAGYEALVLDDNSSFIPSAPSPAAFIAVGDNVVYVSGRWSLRDDFPHFLDSLDIR